MSAPMMRAYHSDSTTKANLLAQLQAHARADEIIKGQYWENGKGCAVGCTVHSGEHALYESLYEIPAMLAHLEDRIFEGLPNERAKAWPIEFADAVQVGADLSRAGWQFLYWLITDEAVNPGISHPIVKEPVARCASIMKAKGEGQEVTASAARSAAASAESAWSAAWSAAESAESAASAARSAGAGARSAAYVLMADKLLEILKAST